VDEGLDVERKRHRLAHHRRPVVDEIVVAVDQDRPVRPADDLGQALGAELGQRHVDGAGEVPFRELALGARVEDQHVGIGRGREKGRPVDQPGQAIVADVAGEPMETGIVDLRVARRGGGERRRGQRGGGAGGGNDENGTEHGVNSSKGEDIVTAMELSPF
jgi:hypothetical protein